MRIVDYQDGDGITHRVSIPDSVDIPPEQGLPISLNLDMLFNDLPLHFRQQFYKNLWDLGLITACDYLQPGASEIFRRALLATIRSDFIMVKELANEGCKK